MGEYLFHESFENRTCCSKWTRQRIIVWTLIGIVGLAVLGLGISCIVIYDTRNDMYVGGDDPCPKLPDLGDSFTFEKDIWSQWNWQYSMDNNNVEVVFEQYCPTVTHDSNVFVDGEFIGRTDEKLCRSKIGT